jgi:hypothetical protein
LGSLPFVQTISLKNQLLTLYKDYQSTDWKSILFQRPHKNSHHPYVGKNSCGFLPDESFNRFARRLRFTAIMILIVGLGGSMIIYLNAEPTSLHPLGYAPLKDTLSGTLGTEPEELQMMSFDCKSGLSGNKLLKDGKIAVTALHGLRAQTADKHVGMPRSRSDIPVFTTLIMDPFQIAHILQRPDCPVHGCLADLLRCKNRSGLGDRKPRGITFKNPPHRLALRGKTLACPVELLPELFLW